MSHFGYFWRFSAISDTGSTRGGAAAPGLVRTVGREGSGEDERGGVGEGNGRAERRRLGDLASARMNAGDLARLDATARRFGMARGEYIRTVLRQSLDMTPEMRFLAEEIAAARLLPIEVRAAEDTGDEGRGIDLKSVVARVEAAKAGMADRMFARFQSRLVKGQENG